MSGNDTILRNVALRPPIHDDPMPGNWLCGRCPYMNVGVVCTKCGAPRYEGREVSLSVHRKLAALSSWDAPENAEGTGVLADHPNNEGPEAK